ncbi:MAG: helix-turn-helix transcriptional regulator [Chloroflexi bacterium]|nr:helix-turn-helix transcriptional regulator [Chloroflexota bacterium]
MDILNNLTERELEILEILSQGKSNKELADSLGISENTVEQHLKNIYEKLNVQNRTEAAGLFLKGKNER